MNITYEIRTSRNVPVFAYDNLGRAKIGLKDAEKRVGIKMRLYEIVRTERDITE